MKGYRKVLIAVNGSTEPLRQGLALAFDEKCWITVVKVIPPYEGDLNLTGIRNIRDVIDGGGEKAIEEIKKIAADKRALVKTRLEKGEAYKKIVEVAQEERCDLIIIGSQKRTHWLKRLFCENVVEKVIGTTPCPVLVVES